jgi:hypothetical protein
MGRRNEVLLQDLPMKILMKPESGLTKASMAFSSPPVDAASPMPRKKAPSASLESTGSAQSIEASTRTTRPPATPVRAHGSISRQIPCSGPRGGNNSLLAQINSLLVRVGNLPCKLLDLQTSSRQIFVKKRPIPRNSLHFSLRPGNSAHQKTGNLSTASRQAACCRERDVLEKDVALATASYSMNGWIPLSPE